MVVFWRPWEDDLRRGSSGEPDRRTYSKEFQQAIVNFYKHIESAGTSNPGPGSSAEEVSKALGVPLSIVYKVLRRGPRSPERRNPKSPAMLKDATFEVLVKKIIYGKYARNEVLTIRSLTKELVENHPGISYEPTSVYRLLLKLGFKWRKISAGRPAAQSVRVARRRQEYLRKVQEYRAAGRVIVYVDETNVDTYDMQVSAWESPATVSPHYNNNSITIHHAGTTDGFLPHCMKVSLATDSRSVPAAGDNQSDNQAEEFEQWVHARLLHALDVKYPGVSCVIAMNNATYHSRRRKSNAPGRKSKQQLLQIMTNLGISIPDDATKVELTALIRSHRREHPEEDPIVDEMVREAGHEVLRLPPYSGELNPSEMVWRQLKGRFRRTASTAYPADAVELLLGEAATDCADLWQTCCRQIRNLEEAFSLENLIANVDEIIIPRDGNFQT